MNFPLDDDLFLYHSGTPKSNGFMESLKIWEFYEIHPSMPRKIIPYGNWTVNEGLKLSKDDKWIRRRNLEVILYLFFFFLQFH